MEYGVSMSDKITMLNKKALKNNSNENQTLPTLQQQIENCRKLRIRVEYRQIFSVCPICYGNEHSILTPCVATSYR